MSRNNQEAFQDLTILLLGGALCPENQIVRGGSDLAVALERSAWSEANVAFEGMDITGRFTVRALLGLVGTRGLGPGTAKWQLSTSLAFTIPQEDTQPPIAPGRHLAQAVLLVRPDDPARIDTYFAKGPAVVRGDPVQEAYYRHRDEEHNEPAQDSPRSQLIERFRSHPDLRDALALIRPTTRGNIRQYDFIRTIDWLIQNSG